MVLKQSRHPGRSRRFTTVPGCPSRFGRHPVCTYCCPCRGSRALSWPQVGYWRSSCSAPSDLIRLSISNFEVEKRPYLSVGNYWSVESAEGFREPNKPCAPPGAAAKYKVPGSPPLPPFPHCRPQSPLIDRLLPLPSCMVPRYSPVPRSKAEIVPSPKLPT